MILELKEASKESLNSRKSLSPKRKPSMNSSIMKKCSNSLKARPTAVPRSSRQSRSKSDGWRNCGNISKNVKIDSTTISSSSGPKWISEKCKTKSKRWEQDSSPSRSQIVNVTLLLVSVRILNVGLSSSPWSLISSTIPWSPPMADIGKKLKIQSNNSFKLIKI